MTVNLVVRNGKWAGRVFPVKRSMYYVGRASGCDLQPSSDQVSRNHCAILVNAGLVVVRDLGSRNGTFVNGERVHEQQPLRNGDHLTIGPLELEVQIDSAATISLSHPKTATEVKTAEEIVAATTPEKKDDRTPRETAESDKETMRRSQGIVGVSKATQAKRSTATSSGAAEDALQRILRGGR